SHNLCHTCLSSLHVFLYFAVFFFFFFFFFQAEDCIRDLYVTGVQTCALPISMKAEWTELALLQLQTKDTALRAFVLSVVLVFLVLAAQYESWALPLAVILVVPMCLLSAVVGVLYAGQDVNIFTQVGFVVLVGLAC